MTVGDLTVKLANETLIRIFDLFALSELVHLRAVCGRWNEPAYSVSNQLVDALVPAMPYITVLHLHVYRLDFHLIMLRDLVLEVHINPVEYETGCSVGFWTNVQAFSAPQLQMIKLYSVFISDATLIPGTRYLRARPGSSTAPACLCASTLDWRMTQDGLHL